MTPPGTGKHIACPASSLWNKKADLREERSGFEVTGDWEGLMKDRDEERE